MLTGEELTRAAKSRLHFIGDEHDSVPVANLLHDTQELLRRRHKSAFAEHRLDDHRRHRLRGHDTHKCIFQVMRAMHGAAGVRQPVRAAVAICVWDAVNIARERLEARLIRMRLAGQRHRQQEVRP